MKLISLKKVCDLTSLSRTSIYRLIEANDFPQKVVVTRGRLAFVEREVEAWIMKRINRQREHTPQSV